MLDLRGSISTFVHISDGKLHDVNVLDLLTPEPGACFVTRAKSNSKFKRLVFLTNQMSLLALTVCALYKKRWQVELFSTG